MLHSRVHLVMCLRIRPISPIMHFVTTQPGYMNLIKKKDVFVSNLIITLIITLTYRGAYEKQKRKIYIIEMLLFVFVT